jgi:hypothetical protein
MLVSHRRRAGCQRFDLSKCSSKATCSSVVLCVLLGFFTALPRLQVASRSASQAAGAIVPEAASPRQLVRNRRLRFRLESVLLEPLRQLGIGPLPRRHAFAGALTALPIVIAKRHLHARDQAPQVLGRDL